MKGKIILGTHRKPTRYFIEGKEVDKDTYDLAFPAKQTDVPPNAQTEWSREVISDGLAVLPKRAKEAEELCKKHGVPTDFSTHRGRPVFTSKAHRKQVLKIFGRFDRNSFFGN